VDSILLNCIKRVALYEEITDKIEPDFTKIRNLLNQKVKNLMKDLLIAVKDEDERMSVNILHMLMSTFEEIYKYMGMREFKNKLKNITEVQFED
jgi:hypothetical protein